MTPTEMQEFIAAFKRLPKDDQDLIAGALGLSDEDDDDHS